MAYTTIDDPEKYFRIKLYTGNATDATGITFDTTDTTMQPDLVWIKNRNSTNEHNLVNSVVGATKYLHSNLNQAETTAANSLQSFDSNGFTVGTNANFNTNTNTYVAWCWKAGTTSGLSGGDITPSSYSYNATSGFGIYKYTGNGSTDQEIPHGLGKKPQIVFYKRLDSSTNWVVQSNLLGNRVQLVINDTTAENTDSRLGASDDWSTTIFNVGTYGDMNSSSDPHVAYAFCNIQGYQKIGTYNGNGNADGAFVYTGFKPAWVMIKNADNSSEEWGIWDSKRDVSNLMTRRLVANINAAENTADYLDFVSNGFKLRTSANGLNQSANLIYLAFAEAPFVNSKGVPCNAR